MRVPPESASLAPIAGSAVASRPEPAVAGRGSGPTSRGCARWPSGSWPCSTPAFPAWPAGADPATRQETVAGFGNVMSDLRSRSSAVVVIQDPRTQRVPTDCLLTAGARLRDCAFNPSPAWETVDQGVRQVSQGVASIIRTNQWLCAHQVCPMVIDHVIVYLNTGHVTSTFATWVKRPLGRELHQVTGL